VAQSGSLAANAQNAYAQQAVQLAGSAQAAQAQSAVRIYSTSKSGENWTKLFVFVSKKKMIGPRCRLRLSRQNFARGYRRCCSSGRPRYQLCGQ